MPQADDQSRGLEGKRPRLHDCDAGVSFFRPSVSRDPIYFPGLAAVI